MTDTQTPQTRSGRRGRGARRDARTAFTQRFLRSNCSLVSYSIALHTT